MDETPIQVSDPICPRPHPNPNTNQPQPSHNRYIDSSPVSANKYVSVVAATPSAAKLISYVSYHTRTISMGITKAESRTLIDAAHHAKGRLCRMRVGAPAALA
jgi:hypothetical protein